MPPPPQVVLAEKPNISDDTFSLDPSVLDELISHLSTLAAIYHKPPSTFVTGRKSLVPTSGMGGDDDEDDGGDGGITSDMMSEGDAGTQAAPPAPPPPAIDLLGGLMDDDPPAQAAPPPGMGGMGGGLEDIFGMGAPAAPAAPAFQNKVTMDAQKGEGMEIRSAFAKENGKVVLQVTISNQTMGPLSGFAVQFNKNSFGLIPENPNALGQCLPQSIAPGQSASGSMPCAMTGPLSDSKGAVQMAVKTNVKVFYMQDVAELHLFTTPDGKIDQQAFLGQWKTLPGEHRVDITGVPPQSEVVETICPKLEQNSIFFIARRKLPDGADMVYLSCKTFNGHVLLAEVGFRPGSGAASIVVKAPQPQYVPLFATSIEALLKK